MLKRAFLTTTALAALTATALAADLPRRMAPPPMIAVPVFTWTGFYIGANAGYAFSTQRNAVNIGNNAAFDAGAIAAPGGFLPRTVNVDQDGFTGGMQIGYNVQFGSFVVGLEADAAYTDLSSRRAVTRNTFVSTYGHDLNFLGTVRGRVGYAFDRLLIYGTGGLAYGDVNSRTTSFFLPGAAGGFVDYVGARSGIDLGWTAGAGVEYALPTSFSIFNSSAVTLKAEALYYDLGRRNVVAGPTALGVAPGFRTNYETNGVIARAGINIKFGTW